jgi:hypothetical protein
MSPVLFLVISGALFIVCIVALCILEIRDEQNQRENVLSFYRNWI